MVYVRQALKRFVDEQMQPSDLVAIIRTAGSMGVMQQFTSDKRQLYSAIESVRWYPMGRAGISALSDPIRDSQIEQEEFTLGTLGSLSYIINGMHQLPGRKSIVLLSDGFSLEIHDEEGGGIDDTGQILDKTRRLIELANRASVIINSIDARGLVAVGQNGKSLAEASSLLEAMPGGGNNKLYETQEGLISLSGQTGGRAFINNNDIQGSIQKVLEDQKGYYLLAYQPDETTFDAKTRRFNRLKIRLKRSDLKVRYRNGFFGVTNEEIGLSESRRAPQEEFLSALISPFGASDIGLKLHALFGNDARQGSFIRSVIHVQAKDLKFTDEPDGTKKAVFNIAASTFGDNGVPVDTVSKTYTLAVATELYREWMNKGFVYQITLPIKKPGAYQLRVALRDEQGEKVGAASQFVEVPDLKNDRLVLSGIRLQSVTPDQIKEIVKGQQPAGNQNQTEAPDPQTDTALRRFRRAVFLQYAYAVYNAKLDQTKSPRLQAQVRVFRDGKIFFEGKPVMLDPNGQTDAERLRFNGAISLPADMDLGEYVLQIILTDTLAKDNRRIASQWIDFEVIK
jgi:VWFA-related protein